MDKLYYYKERTTSGRLGELSSIEQYFGDKHIVPFQTIFVEGFNKKIISRRKVIEDLEHICCRILIKFGQQYFKLNSGLPQGLSVSSVLNALYFGTLEEKYTRDVFREFPDCAHLIMR